MRYGSSITVSVDVDIDDVLEEITTKELEEELASRTNNAEWDRSEVSQMVTSIANVPEFSLTDQEICDIILKKLGRR